MKLVYEVWLDAGMRIDYIGNESLHLKKNDWAVIDFDHYQDYGRILFCRGKLPENVDESSMPHVSRIATLHDQSKAHENYIKNKSLIRKARSIVGIRTVPFHQDQSWRYPPAD